MTAPRHPVVLRLFATVVGLSISPAFATAQELPTPPLRPDTPLWLRPPGEVPDLPDASGESGGDSRGEGRREDEIEPDRDSFTPAVTTTGRGRLIAESAYSFIDNRRVKETHSFPELLLRYGVTDRVELRLGWNYEAGGAPSDITSTSLSGGTAGGAGLERGSVITYGVKVAITEQRNWLPASVLIVLGATPTSGEATDTQLVATYAWGWELPNRWKFDAAFRYSTGSEHEDHFDVFAPSAVLKVPVGEKWGVHAEYFGLFSHNKEPEFVKHYISPGVHYLVTTNLEVDVRVGWGLNDRSARFFTNAGIGWRF
jgi:hypothetical protein